MTEYDTPDISCTDIECPSCGESFDSYHSYGSHYQHCGDSKHPVVALVGVENFSELYKKHGTFALADILPCSRATVTRVANQLGIGEKKGGDIGTSVSFHTRRRGHEYWQVYDGDGEKHTVLVHRLIAVAEYGPDAVSDNDVHHKNGIPWDNRPENLQILTHGEHSSLHGTPTT